MRRADRLFELLQLLRGGRLRTAEQLADALEVSSRTVYRDIADLQAQGVPIDGERGVGYLLRDEYFLPPLALTPLEFEALDLGVRMVRANADAALAGAADELLVKIGAVAKGAIALGGMSVFATANSREARVVLARLRAAVTGRHRLAVAYEDAGGAKTRRVVRPLGLEFWGHVWTLTAWCELRADFRVFRCDRIIEAEPGAPFREEQGKTLEDFVAQMEAMKHGTGAL
ncbi:helix-turn-helix transcriptional regulator [Pelagibacterium xiamenense]|uniref:helix-turn-helix transcriptional regulator n=1 Tax=Pelagibacterium xiamenense TaxID=2901140 RepID=UPI001E648011|nr:YafY family protein [Pelagibacterium xiamenense]MCD7059936.1 YafY family transcriptional regulator [Pelagibacterium xiamenense]